MPLRRFSFLVSGTGPGAGYAANLLAGLGADVVRVGEGPIADLEETVRRWHGPASSIELARLPVAGAIDQDGLFGTGAPFPVVPLPGDAHPVIDWASSGVMALTGDPAGDPLPSPGYQAAYLRGAAGVLALLGSLAGRTAPPVDGAALPGERAAIARLQRQGRTSVGGASRLLPARDGWVAVTLARPTDFEALPAWVGARAGIGPDPWRSVEAAVGQMTSEEVVESAQLLGIAVSAVPPAEKQPEGPPWTFDGSAPTNRRPMLGSATPAARHAPLVVDLSALWAGPLATSLLLPFGARVVKVESRTRPDGARRGPAEFFDLLNGGKESVVLELDRPDGPVALRALIDAADVVVEAGRARVMRNWGIDVEDVVGARRDLTWVSLTGYGRTGPFADRVAFGDDAAAGAGVVAWGKDREPRFCGDAYADAVSGLHAAVAIAAGLVGGGAHLVDVSLTGVCRHMLTGAGQTGGPLPRRLGVEPPRARAPTQAGPAWGQDTENVLAEVGAR